MSPGGSYKMPPQATAEKQEWPPATADLLTDTENMIAFHIPVNFQHFPFYLRTHSRSEHIRIGALQEKGQCMWALLAKLIFINTES